MSSEALAKRAKWQDRANAGGASHEKSVEDVFKQYFSTEGNQDYEFVSKPQILSQLFLEIDYERNPEKYKKPEEPEKGDIYYDPSKGKFFKWVSKKGTEAKLGMIPDGMILNKKTGKAHILEEKHQQNAGNAHERGYRYDTEKIRTSIQKKLNTSAQPVSWIFAGSMTEDQKYILEIQAHLPDNHYILLKSSDNTEEVLINWFNSVIKPLLE